MLERKNAADRSPRRTSSYVREQHDLPLSMAAITFETRGKGDAFQFSGYGSIWDRIDSYGDTMLKGAFAEAIGSRKTMMFFGHDSRRIPGKWIDVQEDDKGLRMVGELTPNHSEAADLEASLRHQSVSGLSVGGYTTKADWVEEDGQIIGRRIHIFDLYETSVVGIPAESEARIDAVSVKQALDSCRSMSELEHLLREVAGLTKSSATAFVARASRIARGDPAVEVAPKAVVDLLDTMRGLTLPTSLLGD